jgi:hypothetical protein
MTDSFQPQQPTEQHHWWTPRPGNSALAVRVKPEGETLTHQNYLDALECRAQDLADQDGEGEDPVDAEQSAANEYRQAWLEQMGQEPYFQGHPSSHVQSSQFGEVLHDRQVHPSDFPQRAEPDPQLDPDDETPTFWDWAQQILPTNH